MPQQLAKGRVGELTIVNYSAMYMPVSMVLLPLYVYVQPYYAELGISLYTMSAILFAARLSDAFTDPLIGVLSDRTKSRWGRRKPWIVAGAPLLMLSLYMLFVPPENVTAWYFGFWIVLLYLAFTIVDLPYFAWGAELSPLYDERTKITARREQFHFAGTITFNLLGIDIFDIHFGTQFDTRMGDRFDQRLIRIQQFHILADQCDSHFAMRIQFGI